MPEPTRRTGPPLPGETDAERAERERNNRDDYVAVVADGGPPYDDEDEDRTGDWDDVVFT